MSKAQKIYERVEALVAEGTTKVDAFQTLATELDQTVNAVRASYYGARRAAGVTPRTRRANETSTDDAIAGAVASLQNSIKKIRDEVTVAENRAAEAVREYEALRDGADAKVAAIDAKIDALLGTDSTK